MQGVPSAVLGSLARCVVDRHQATLRAKKAVACLLFVSGRPMIAIERIITQFGGALGGAAGPIRAVAGRTCDVLPTAARVAEILHPTLDLEDRVGRLAIRLTHGIQGPAVDLAREAGSALLRGDYCQLVDAGLADPDAVAKADDARLLACLGESRQKLAIVREAAGKAAVRRAQAAAAAGPALEPYVA
jgi:helicase